jgi:predicted dehydrogenase/nucleoside-diphosphate-sugar epimerase
MNMSQDSQLSRTRPLRAGLVGTGYIAEFHAKAVKAIAGVDLIAVADPNLSAAQLFAQTWGAKAYASMDEMMAAEQLDVIHILVPPHLHYQLASEALAKGMHVLVEKPMCVSTADAAALVKQAEAAGRVLGVNHTVSAGDAFSRLRRHVQNGEIGPLDYLSINHFLELGTIRFGPYDNWMLREAGNALLEIGSHPISGMVELVGMPDTLDVVADRDVILPGGARAYRRWRIHATAGRTAVDITLDLGPGFGQRTVSARGPLGSVLADIDADTCVIDRRTSSGIDFDRYHRSNNQARQMKDQARGVLGDYLKTKLKLSDRGNPNDKQLRNAIAAFYAELADPKQKDSLVSAASGLAVVDVCNQVIAKANLKPNEPPRKPAAVAAADKPTVLVLGGNGFIGKRLVEQLLAGGYGVRAAGRSASKALEDLANPKLEITRCDMGKAADLETALQGIEVVYHLATSNSNTWPNYQAREIEPTRLLAEACLAKGVKRLIYAGTIDSYYAGKNAGKIVEETPLDPKIGRRNYYARAKAHCEHMLTEMHRTRGLPLVIARPGIVIGKGGNPFHWGVGYWHSEGVCQVWAEGLNKLPLVLVDDVAAGLVLCMQKAGIEGRSYNLIDAPLMSARDYIAELERLAGMKVDVSYRPIRSFFMEDFGKWLVKLAVKHPDAVRRPSYHDWESRTQKAFFDCAQTRSELGWTPASNSDALKSEGIAGSLRDWLAARGG